jgi:hypothetical protein
MSLVLLPHPLNKLVAVALMVAGLGVMAGTVVRVRRGRQDVWSGLALLVAAWLLFTPFAHANDDVLLLLPLAVAWGRNGMRGLEGTRPLPLPLLALWSFSTLPLAFLLPAPFHLLGILPATLSLLAVANPRRGPVAPV